MTRLETQRFGTLELPDEAVLHFEQGLFGFEDLHRFTLVGAGDALSRMQWLISLDNPELALFIIDPTLIRADYSPAVEQADLQAVGLASLEEGIVMAVCVLDKDPAKITANLQAPILFNPLGRKGRQVILSDPSLPVKQPVFQPAGR